MVDTCANGRCDSVADPDTVTEPDANADPAADAQSDHASKPTPTPRSVPVADLRVKVAHTTTTFVGGNIDVAMTITNRGKSGSGPIHCVGRQRPVRDAAEELVGTAGR